MRFPLGAYLSMLPSTAFADARRSVTSLAPRPFPSFASSSSSSTSSSSSSSRLPSTASASVVAAFDPATRRWRGSSIAPTDAARAASCRVLGSVSGEWSVADDWERLSSANNPVEPSDIFNVDLARDAALSMERHAKADGVVASSSDSEEDEFVHDAVESIINPMPDGSDPPLFDTASSFEDYAGTSNFIDDAGREIGLLVRCNERPEDLLIAEGRALKPLTDEERHDPAQLVTSVVVNDDEGGEDGGPQERPMRYEATDFLRNAVSKLFAEHTVSRGGGDVPFLDAAAVARWMSKSLAEPVGSHDKRVRTVISRFGTYGSGVLTEPEFHRLYLDAVVAGLEEEAMPMSMGAHNAAESKRRKVLMKQLKLDQPGIQSVWRDFTNHAILSPAEVEWKRKEEAMTKEYGSNALGGGTAVQTMMDECEILEWGEHDHSDAYFNIGTNAGETSEKERKGSHESVEMATDKVTPLRIRDGQFVFIDEESCIGCAMCAQIAPSSFVMLESGRARTFSQSNSPEVASAVSSCPVSCMHNVAFHELKEYELARDKGDGRTDHRHMGQSRGHTPLNVAGIDSDANHKSSWYHYLKQRCLMSSGCPQRGCYDCPMFSTPGANPFFKALHEKSERRRAQDFIANGDADKWRKTTDL